MINRAPKVVSLTTDLHKHLVQVPSPLRTLPHSFRTPPPDLVCKISTEPIDPVADRFVANVDTALVEQVFDIAQGQPKANVHHHRKLDDFG